jgi:hypothetical protein
MTWFGKGAVGMTRFGKRSGRDDKGQEEAGVQGAKSD